MIKAIILDVDGVATVANGSDELKKLIKSKGEGKYFMSHHSVDENGILDILNYFSLASRRE